MRDTSASYASQNKLWTDLDSPSLQFQSPLLQDCVLELRACLTNTAIDTTHASSLYSSKRQSHCSSTMAPADSSPADNTAILQEILSSLNAIRKDHNDLASVVDSINGRVNTLAGVKQSKDGITHDMAFPSPRVGPSSPQISSRGHRNRDSISSTDGQNKDLNGSSSSPSPETRRKSSVTSKIILTSYPGQAGVDPLPMECGTRQPQVRGPVVVSRSGSSIRRRNAIGAHGGSYSIYYALAVASHQLDTDHRADYTNTEPAADIGPFKAWSDPKKIVAMDPLGHLAPWLFKDIITNDGVEIRPTMILAS